LRVGRLQSNNGLLPAFSYPPVFVAPSDKISDNFKQVKGFFIFLEIFMVLLQRQELLVLTLI